ncbi:ATP-dependent endonuclease [Candidatus Marinimicrobia bacterium MT.SAG.2]|nr:ATP-dependent endonuclease [Candidatus Marinimicrobia bacterium MT.SAG.2]
MSQFRGSLHKRSLEYKNEENFKDIEQNQLNKIIKFESISAKRDVANVDEDSALSKLSYKFFKSTKSSKETDITDLQRKLIKTDSDLNKTYETIFKDIIDNVKKFSYSEKESQLSVLSKLEELNVLKENTSVVYEQEGHFLPEELNGLGYMNLFAMIFNIHIIMDLFKTKNLESKRPADINLLFIEEPEAHTHPQMQYVFIKNIKNLLQEEGKDLNNLQTIISTHSAHITSQCDFNDIKYFLRENSNIIVKNISELQKKYEDRDSDKSIFQFLKQYLTLNRAELFFSEKLILIEGDTERILIPAMMKKIDLENKDVKEYTPLLSQNISVTEVGAYSHIFDQFIDFLQIKTMIITDIDSVEPAVNGKACPVSKGTHTSNASIRYFTNDKSLNELIKLDFKDKIFLLKDNKWESHKDGNLCITYQTEENEYHARSFEDAFISLNLEYIKSNKDSFKSLKNREVLEATSPDYYEIAKNCIGKKSIFATDILYYSNSEFSDWDIPKYIKDSLLWLAE